MPSVTSSLENLFHALSQILGGVVQSFIAVGNSIVALAFNLVHAIFSIGQAFFTAIVDMMSGLAGFVLGKKGGLARLKNTFLSEILGNIFIILALGAGYWFWSTQTASGRQKTAGGKKNPLK